MGIQETLLFNYLFIYSYDLIRQQMCYLKHLLEKFRKILFKVKCYTHPINHISYFTLGCTMVYVKQYFNSPNKYYFFFAWAKKK